VINPASLLTPKPTNCIFTPLKNYSPLGNRFKLAIYTMAM